MRRHHYDLIRKTVIRFFIYLASILKKSGIESLTQRTFWLTPIYYGRRPGLIEPALLSAPAPAVAAAGVPVETGVMPLTVSRQLVTTLWVSPPELFAVVIQLIKDFKSFEDRDLVEEVPLLLEEEVPLLLILLFFEAASAE
jgi:hypothetical protein